jgi:hypothetical protein
LNLEALAAQHLAQLPREPHLHNKRTLASQARELLEAADADPAAVDLLLERHAVELPERAFSLTGDDGPPPARDPFVELGQETPGPHADLNRALILAEVAAATAAEAGDAETRLRLARFAERQLERTVEIDVALEEPWGTQPVDVSEYGRLMALPAGDRIAELVREGRGGDEDAAL